MQAQVVSAVDASHPQRTNIASLYIEVTKYDKRNRPLEPTDKVTYLPCRVRLVENGQMTTYELTEEAGGGIRGRGNSTWGAQKKPWRLKFDSKVELLGKDFANAKSWTLLANSYDKSLIRNAVTYHMGKFMGLPFNPCYKFVDLYMNGSYRGTYQISDQMEVREKRIDVNSKTGWLLEYSQANAEDPKFDLFNNNTNYGPVEIKSPEFTNDDKNTNLPLYNEIKAYTNDVFAKLNEQNKNIISNPFTGYRSVVDEKALIDWYVATEITKNWDGLYSVYMHRQSDETKYENTKLCFGPLWDEDLAYGQNAEQYPSNAGYQDNDLLVFSNHTNSSIYRKLHPVIANLFTDPWFAASAQRRFAELDAAGIEAVMLNAVDALAAEIKRSAADNFIKWNIYTTDVGSYIRTVQGWTWQDYIDDLKLFIHNRMPQLRAAFQGKAQGTQWFNHNDQNKPAAKTAQNVIIERNFKADMWNTICLPCSMTRQEVDRIFGEGTIVKEFTNTTYDANGQATLVFSEVRASGTSTCVRAGVPYFIKPTRDFERAVTVLNKDVVVNTVPVQHGGYSLRGTFSPIRLKEDGTQFFVGAGNKLMTPIVGSSPLKGLRAYITCDNASAHMAKLMIDDELTTDIESLNDDLMQKTENGVYTINGQYVGESVQNLQKGVYIVNGKKIVIK